MKVTFPQSLASWFNWIMGLAGAAWSALTIVYSSLAGSIDPKYYPFGMVIVSVINGVLLYIQGHPVPNAVTTTTATVTTKTEATEPPAPIA